MTMNQKVKGVPNTLEHRPEHLWSNHPSKLAKVIGGHPKSKGQIGHFEYWGSQYMFLGRIFFFFCKELKT